MARSGYFAATRSPIFSFAVTSPLLLVYNLVYFLPGTEWHNGVDFIGLLLLKYTGSTGFLLFNLVLFVVTLGIFLHKRSKGDFSFVYVLLLALESALYGLATGILTVRIMKKLFLMGPHSPASWPIAVITSAGAGYHEELFFRLLLLGGPWTLLSRVKKGVFREVLMFIVLIINPVLFSLAHFLGSEDFSVYAFYFRFFTGLIFSLIYLFRGFAVAAYTHFFYDLMVFLL